MAMNMFFVSYYHVFGLQENVLARNNGVYSTHLQNSPQLKRISTMQKTIEVSKETYELGEGLTKFIDSCFEALEDGWQYGDDLPDIISSAVSNLLPALDGASLISDERKKNPRAFYTTISLMIVDIADAAGVFDGRTDNK